MRKRLTGPRILQVHQDTHWFGKVLLLEFVAEQVRGSLLERVINFALYYFSVASNDPFEFQQ